MARNIVLVLLTLHTLITLYALRDASVSEVFPPFREDFVYQIFSDLSSALGMVFVLCYLQLKRQKRPMKPLVVAMLATIPMGSFAPLIYLLLDKKLLTDLDASGDK